VYAVELQRKEPLQVKELRGGSFGRRRLPGERGDEAAKSDEARLERAPEVIVLCEQHLALGLAGPRPKPVGRQVGVAAANLDQCLVELSPLESQLPVSRFAPLPLAAQSGETELALLHLRLQLVRLLPAKLAVSLGGRVRAQRGVERPLRRRHRPNVACLEARRVLLTLAQLGALRAPRAVCSVHLEQSAEGCHHRGATSAHGGQSAGQQHTGELSELVLQLDQQAAHASEH